ncbi:MAG TPA: hypothetical protein VMV41_00090 [Cellulomonadaceae bacterium]|nr:hypothetical protein [Cellulomonadaceae bacterium]
MSIQGTVQYQITESGTQLFPALGNSMTLYLTAGSAKVWVSTTAAVKRGVGLPMNPLASVAWDSDKACYACTDGPGQTATLIGIDLNASVNDPTLLASLISSGTVDATAIANAIAASGLTSAGIAAAIKASGLDPLDIGAAVGAYVPTAGAIGAAVAAPSAAAIGAAVPSAAAIGAAVPQAADIATALRVGVTPVLLQLLGLASAVGNTRNAVTAWVGAAAQAAGWTVPVGKTLAVRHVSVQAVNTGATAAQGQLRLVEGGGGGANKVHHAISLRLAGTGVGGVEQAIEGESIEYGAGIEPQVQEVSGATGVTYDVNLIGVLY